MSEELKPGEVVQLKSGGPPMTIEGIGKYGMGATTDRANCVWFEGTKRIEGLFELHTLQKVPPRRPSATFASKRGI
jgi:uncharacterized protein YodC (DUF2158 family)